MDDRTMIALLLSTAAGMATMVGAGAAVLFRRPPAWMMAFSLGLAAGVMTGVSLSELLPEGISVLLIAMPGAAGIFAAGAAAAAGALFAAFLELMVPREQGRSGYRRLGLLSMIVLLVHNLPEGVAVFLSGNSDLHAGLVLCAAIALHNIPEGISVAMPLTAAGEGRGRALLMAAVSGFAEPAGALLAWRFLAGRLGESGLALIYCGVGGLMTALSFGELLPAARRTGRRGPAFCGVLLGAAVMILAGQIEL